MKKILALIITLFISVTALSAGSIERLEREIRNTPYFSSYFVRIKSDDGTEILIDINNPNLIFYTYTSGAALTKKTVMSCYNYNITFVNMDIDHLIKILDDLRYSSKIKRIDDLNIRIVRYW